MAVPAASTIRAWAAADGWAAQRDADRAQTHGRTLRELQAGFLSAVVLAENTLLDAMVGLLDGAPYGGSGRIKAAEAVLRLAERAGVRFLASALELEPPEVVDEATLSEEQLRLLRAIPIFAPLAPPTLERLAREMIPVDAPAGAVPVPSVLSSSPASLPSVSAWLSAPVALPDRLACLAPVSGLFLAPGGTVSRRKMLTMASAPVANSLLPHHG